jgi:hypothetical protein
MIHSVVDLFARTIYVMKHVIEKFLTDASARNPEALTALVAASATAGIPWQ